MCDMKGRIEEKRMYVLDVCHVSSEVGEVVCLPYEATQKRAVDIGRIIRLSVY